MNGFVALGEFGKHEVCAILRIAPWSSLDVIPLLQTAKLLFPVAPEVTGRFPWLLFARQFQFSQTFFELSVLFSQLVHIVSEASKLV